MSTNTPYTPGPWMVQKDEECFIISECFKDGSDLAITNLLVSVGNEAALANAQLCACSPELLEALQEAVKGAEFDNACDEHFKGATPMPSWYTKAKQAISKALNK